jgi:hypothetical protein
LLIVGSIQLKLIAKLKGVKMIAFCVHCGASMVDEIIVTNGEIMPGKDVLCSNCGKPAGIKNESGKKKKLSNMVAKKGEIIIKDGKIR